jgi:hypothetical protein
VHRAGKLCSLKNCLGIKAQPATVLDNCIQNVDIMNKASQTASIMDLGLHAGSTMVHTGVVDVHLGKERHPLA